MTLIKSVIRSGILNLLGRWAIPSPRVHIIAGHRLASGISGKLVAKKNIDMLAKWCDFCNFDEAVRLILNDTHVERPQVAFCFDDGIIDCLDIAEVLTSIGVNGAFFINPSFVLGDLEYRRWFAKSIIMTKGARPLESDDIKYLARCGFEIGAHTLDHLRLSLLDQENLERQIVLCKSVVQEISGVECRYFAWPYGTYRDISTNALNLASCNYEAVFSSECNIRIFGSLPNIINRRHIELDWPIEHIRYFLSQGRVK